jgi:hypothetical protein
MGRNRRKPEAKRADRPAKSNRGKLSVALMSLAEEARNADRSLEKAAQLEADLVTALDKVSRLEVELDRAESQESPSDVLPDGVISLRDGSYETDEKIRVFASAIHRMTLPQLESMLRAGPDPKRPEPRAIAL